MLGVDGAGGGMEKTFKYGGVSYIPPSISSIFNFYVTLRPAPFHATTSGKRQTKLL